jgi:phosphotransferase system HPr-like phosphotransfer protein
MKEFQYTILDPVGMHARPAGKLAKEAANIRAPSPSSRARSRRTPAA